MAERYVTAAGRLGATRLYDRTVALTMREPRWRPALVERAVRDLPAGARVLDLGAGTGTLALQLAAARPDVEVHAVDGDPEALAIARGKPGAERVTWREGLAGELPDPDASADAVVLSLVLHHLGTETKRRALADVARILRSGGRLHIADWGRPGDLLAAPGFLALRALDGFAPTADHARGRLPALLAEAGLPDVTRHGRLRTVWGTLELLEAAAAVTVRA